jgi:gluconate 2-dehydrogenase gamma chain
MLVAACWAEALRAQGSYRYFDAAMASEVEAVAETILPGAGVAGVIWFIDGALAGYDKDKQADYQKGMTALKGIAGMTLEERVKLVGGIEKTEFFALVRKHTVLGFFGSPKYGGNRNGAAAKLLGYEEEMMYTPPFGYYDREAAQ